MRSNYHMHRLLAVLAGFVVAVLLASAAGAAPRKRPPSQFGYTLSVKLDVNYDDETDTGSHKLTEQVTFAGESQPFLLIRSGTASKPSYTISALRTPSVPLMLRVPGLLNLTGTGFTSTPQCTLNQTYAITGDRSAAANVLLIRNRLRHQVTSLASVNVHSETTCGVVAPDYVCGNGKCLFLSPNNPTAVAWPQQWSLLQPSLVRFGKPFTVTRHIDPAVDPILHVVHYTSDGTTLSQNWSYKWTLTFTPAQTH